MIDRQARVKGVYSFSIRIGGGGVDRTQKCRQYTSMELNIPAKYRKDIEGAQKNAMEAAKWQ